MQFWFQVSKLVRFWSLQVFQLLQLCLFVILSFLKPRTYVTHAWLIWHWVRLPVSRIVFGKMTHWQKDLIVTIGMHMDQNRTIVISRRQKSHNWNKEDKNHTIVILVDQNRTIETTKPKSHNLENENFYKRKSSIIIVCAKVSFHPLANQKERIPAFVFVLQRRSKQRNTSHFAHLDQVAGLLGHNKQQANTHLWFDKKLSL